VYILSKYLICEDCEWISEEYPKDANFYGPGGQLGCPECTKHNRNQNLEVNGHIIIMTDSELRDKYGWNWKEEFKKSEDKEDES